MVEAEVDGLGQVFRVTLDPALVERKDREMIEDLIPAAINIAVAKSKELHAEVIKRLDRWHGFPRPQGSPRRRRNRFARRKHYYRRFEKLIVQLPASTQPKIIAFHSPLDHAVRYQPDRTTGQAAWHRPQKCGANYLPFIRVSNAEALALADAIRDVKENVRYCKTCYNLSES